MRFGGLVGVLLCSLGCAGSRGNLAHAENLARAPYAPPPASQTLHTHAVAVADPSYDDALANARAAGERALQLGVPKFYSGDESAWNDFVQLSFAPWIRRVYAELDIAHDAFGRAASRARGNEERTRALGEWAVLDLALADRVQGVADAAIQASRVESEPRGRFERSVEAMIEPLRSRARDRSGSTALR